MSLPLHSLSITTLLQPLFELNALLQQLKNLKVAMDSLIDTIHRPELHDHPNAMKWHLDQVIHAYESLLDQAAMDFRNILREYAQQTWQTPPQVRIGMAHRDCSHFVENVTSSDDQAKWPSGIPFSAI